MNQNYVRDLIGKYYEKYSVIQNDRWDDQNEIIRDTQTRPNRSRIKRSMFSGMKYPKTLIGEFLGNSWDRFTGKLIYQKSWVPIQFFLFWGVTQNGLLENSSIRFFWLKPYMICNILSGFSSKTVHPVLKKTEYVLMIFWWMSFPVKRSQKFPRNLPIRVTNVVTFKKRFKLQHCKSYSMLRCTQNALNISKLRFKIGSRRWNWKFWENVF